MLLSRPGRRASTYAHSDPMMTRTATEHSVITALLRNAAASPPPPALVGCQTLLKLPQAGSRGNASALVKISSAGLSDTDTTKIEREAEEDRDDKHEEFDGKGLHSVSISHSRFSR